MLIQDKKSKSGETISMANSPNLPSKTFADYKAEKYIWITTAKGQYYPERKDNQIGYWFTKEYVER